MFSFLSPYKLLIQIGLVVALVFGAIYAYNAFVDKHQDIGYQRAVSEYQKKLIEANARADKIESVWKSKSEEAQHAFAQRETRLQNSVTAAAVANDGLHNTIGDLRKRLSTNTSEANRATADALAVVFGECAERYPAVAEAADGRTIEALRLSESWPDN